MRFSGKIVICLANWLALSAGLRAEDGALPDNPYTPIVARNVFGLNPPAAVDATATQTEPPPKITPNGIMSIFGQLQVLFKVATPAKPGQPAKEDSYILSEGQRQDEIEVVKIDEGNSLVTFNNHGAVQELALAKANPPPANTIVAPGRPYPNPRFPERNGEGGNRIPGRSPGRPGAAQNPAARTENNNINNNYGGYSLNAGGAVVPPTPSPAQQEQSAEATALLLINTEKLKSGGNPAWKIMPPPPPRPGAPPSAQ